MNLPLKFRQINFCAGHYSPATIKPYNNAAFAFWREQLSYRAISVIKYNLPEIWKENNANNFFKYAIAYFGFLGVADFEGYGTIFNPCTVQGFNVFYQPTQALFSNPAFKTSVTKTIGVDCAILRLTPNDDGICNIIDYYAEKLAQLDVAINTSIINSKVPYFMGAKNKAAGEALKKMLDKINKGEAAVVYDTKILDQTRDKSPFEFISTNAAANYLTDRQLADFKQIIAAFDVEIGIPTIPAKTERMITAEADVKKYESFSKLDLWIDTFNESAKDVKKLFGLDVSAEKSDILLNDENGKLDEGGAENGNNETDT